jgi:hypothetical protein
MTFYSVFGSFIDEVKVASFTTQIISSKIKIKQIMDSKRKIIQMRQLISCEETDALRKCLESDEGQHAIHVDMGRACDLLLRYAIIERPTMVSVLVDHGFALRWRYQETSHSALEIAVSIGSVDLCTMFLDLGMDMNLLLDDYENAFHIACRNSIECTEIMIERGANLNKRTSVAGNSVEHLKAGLVLARSRVLLERCILVESGVVPDIRFKVVGCDLLHGSTRVDSLLNRS